MCDSANAQMDFWALVLSHSESWPMSRSQKAERFWIDRHTWPNDPKDHVFFGRAIDELGRAIYGNAWTGNEYTVGLRQLPPQLPEYLAEQRLGYQLLKKHRPDMVLPQANSFGTPHESLTLEQWAAAVAIYNPVMNEIKCALERKAVVEDELVKRCEAKELIAYHRPTFGGELRPIPASWWCTEVNHNRFVMCQINPRRPFEDDYSGEDFAWIFLARDSLDRCLSLLPHWQPGATQGHLSPYLRAMLFVARSLDITVDNQPKKDVVVEELRQAWGNNPPLSSRLIDAMATLLREPESQSGRTQSTGKPPDAR